MKHIIKLTVKDHCTVRADSSPDVPVNEFVEIPTNHYGEFYIRLTHGKEGIMVPSSPFPAKWEGTPKITVVNNSANDLYLRAGDEIGELHIRYNPPSPLFGKEICLVPPFCYKRHENKILVIDKECRKYECEELILTDFTDHAWLTPDQVSDQWTRHDFISSFRPSSAMVNYEQVLVPTLQELHDCEIINSITLGRDTANHTHTHNDNACEGERVDMGKFYSESLDQGDEVIELRFPAPSASDILGVLGHFGFIDKATYESLVSRIKKP